MFLTLPAAVSISVIDQLAIAVLAIQYGKLQSPYVMSIKQARAAVAEM
jgi:hypothetical protein